MTTPARKPSTAASDNLMMIVGQLLEATKAASDGLKSVNAEHQNHSRAIITASKTLEMVEEKVAELDDLIRDGANDHNLMRVTQTHTTELANLHVAVGALKLDLSKLGASSEKMTSQGEIVWQILKFVGWLLTLAVAIIALMQGKAP